MPSRSWDVAERYKLQSWSMARFRSCRGPSPALAIAWRKASCCCSCLYSPAAALTGSSNLPSSSLTCCCQSSKRWFRAINSGCSFSHGWRDSIIEDTLSWESTNTFKLNECKPGGKQAKKQRRWYIASKHFFSTQEQQSHGKKRE